jgi:hypothetical protein
MFDPRFVWQYLCARFNIDRNAARDAGALSAEMAVLVFVVVAGALTVATIIMNFAQNKANSIGQ